jgi:hypothetical protein
MQKQAKKIKTEVSCPYCRDFFTIGIEHVCQASVLDKDSQPPKLKAAKVKTIITWD